MQTKKFQEILNKIAKEHNTTPEDVYTEMQLAIDAAYNSPDPEARAKWAAIPKKGDKTTVEEFIDFSVTILKIMGC